LHLAWFAGVGDHARVRVALFDNSLAYDSPQAERLREAAKRNSIFVVMGLSERAGGSLYIAQWIIGPNGETIAQRRKLKPTHAERTVFGEGDGRYRDFPHDMLLLILFGAEVDWAILTQCLACPESSPCETPRLPLPMIALD
jgi:predicted amidohydrolase